MNKFIFILPTLIFYSCATSNKKVHEFTTLNAYNPYIDLGTNKEFVVLKSKFYDDTCISNENCFSLYFVRSIDLKDTFLIYDNSMVCYNRKEIVTFISNGKKINDYPIMYLPSVTEEKPGRVMAISDLYSNKYHYSIGKLVRK